MYRISDQPDSLHHTLRVHKTDAGKTRVTCDNVPELSVEDTDQRFAVQEMRRLLDDRQTRRQDLILPED